MYLKISAMNEVFNPKVGLRALFSGPHWLAPYQGIKPLPKKVQAILALNPPKNVKELRRFLGMVQYYRDMWARRSEMLAPLTDLVGECGETKTTRMNKTKKNLGGGIQFINKRLMA
jgi:hypothetical protein